MCLRPLEASILSGKLKNGFQKKGPDCRPKIGQIVLSATIVHILGPTRRLCQYKRIKSFKRPSCLNPTSPLTASESRPGAESRPSPFSIAPRFHSGIHLTRFTLDGLFSEFANVWFRMASSGVCWKHDCCFPVCRPPRSIRPSGLVG